MIKLFLFLLLTFFSFNARADWLLITTSENDNNYYVETNSVTYKNKLVSYWQLDDYSNNGKHSSTKNKKENNCTTDEFRIVSQIEFSGKMGGGDVINMKKEGPWLPIAPQTIGEMIHKFVCNKK